MQTDLGKVQKYLDWTKQKIYYHTAKQYQRKWTFKKGEVYFIDLGENIGSEENKKRPCVILSASSHGFSSPVITCSVLSTSQITIPDIQVQIVGNYLYTDENGNSKKLSGAIDLGHIITVAKERVVSKKICLLNKELNEIDEKLMNYLGLKPLLNKRDNVISSLEGKINYLKEENSR